MTFNRQKAGGGVRRELRVAGRAGRPGAEAGGHLRHPAHAGGHPDPPGPAPGPGRVGPRRPPRARPGNGPGQRFVTSPVSDSCYLARLPLGPPPPSSRGSSSPRSPSMPSPKLRPMVLPCRSSGAGMWSKTASSFPSEKPSPRTCQLNWVSAASSSGGCYRQPVLMSPILVRCTFSP